MKKNLSVLLVVVMAISALTACGSKSKEEASNAAAESSSVEAATAESSNDIASLQNLDKLEVKTLDEINPLDYVTLSEYKGLTVEVAPVSVTDEDVDGYIKNLIESNPAKTEITDRPIQKGDIANIDYEGKFADTGVQIFLVAQAKNLDVISHSVFSPHLAPCLPGNPISSSFTVCPESDCSPSHPPLPSLSKPCWSLT